MSQKVTIEAKGEVLQLVNTINTMVDRLATFASEVTRVAIEVGTKGNLGVTAKVDNIEGTWQEITLVYLLSYSSKATLLILFLVF